jgi:LCP family protein required for cell wall assembly
MVARFLPASRVELLSIPRDLWVPIAGGGGSAKVNSAFDAGPNRLVETIQHDLNIPINHVVMVNFCGLTSMVNSLGGVSMDFLYPVRDQFSGLDVTHTGCQTVTGTEALQLVRSRHLWYFAHGQWNYDGMSDFSRIRRQQAFFHALFDRLHSVVPNVFRLVSFVGAAAKGVAVDSGFSSTAMMALGWDYHSLSQNHLYTSTLPTSEGFVDGQDVLLTVPQDHTVITAFLDGNVGTFSSALGARGVVHLMSVVNPNALKEPWNPTPC